MSVAGADHHSWDQRQRGELSTGGGGPSSRADRTGSHVDTRIGEGRERMAHHEPAKTKGPHRDQATACTRCREGRRQCGSPHGKQKRGSPGLWSGPPLSGQLGVVRRRARRSLAAGRSHPAVEEYGGCSPVTGLRRQRRFPSPGHSRAASSDSAAQLDWLRSAKGGPWLAAARADARASVSRLGHRSCRSSTPAACG